MSAWQQYGFAVLFGIAAGSAYWLAAKAFDIAAALLVHRRPS